MNEALRNWVTYVHSTYYVIGTTAGPHPYPGMVRDFQSVIGHEARAQHKKAEGRLPDYLVAAVGGGSNALGLFYPFLNDPGVRLIGVEAAGYGIASGKHAAPLCAGKVGVLHGNMTYLLQDDFGQIANAHSISAGLDYPGVGPEHAWLKDTGRASYVSITDEEALEGFKVLTLEEGILPALESSHAIAHVLKLAPTLSNEETIVVCLSGRGDKDIHTVAEVMGVKLQ
jgi:tryptophan synthase beta chain